MPQLVKYSRILQNGIPRRKRRQWKAHRIAQGQHWWAQLGLIYGLYQKSLQTFFWFDFGVRPLHHGKVRVSTSRRSREFPVTGHTLYPLLTTTPWLITAGPIANCSKKCFWKSLCGLLKGSLWLLKMCCPRPRVYYVCQAPPHNTEEAKSPGLGSVSASMQFWASHLINIPLVRKANELGPKGMYDYSFNINSPIYISFTQAFCPLIWL